MEKIRVVTIFIIAQAAKRIAVSRWSQIELSNTTGTQRESVSPTAGTPAFVSLFGNCCCQCHRLVTDGCSNTAVKDKEAMRTFAKKKRGIM